MRNVIQIFVAGLLILIFAAGMVLAFIQERRETAPTGPAINTSDIPPDMYQRAVSIHEERREMIDFFVAPPELIQQSLNGKKVLTYDQN